MGMHPQLSIWSAESEGIELAETTIGALLDARAQASPDASALIFRAPEIGAAISWSYGELRANAVRTACALIRLGIGKGDKVAILSHNSPQWIVLEYALAKIGAVMVTVNPAFRDSEVRYLLNNGDVHTLFFTPSYRGFSIADMLRTLVPEAAARDNASLPIDTAQFPALRQMVAMDRPADGFASLDDLLAQTTDIGEKDVADRQAAVAPGDLAQIQYTSGTTGNPKGVMLSHRSTLNNARITVARAGFTQADRMLSPMPLFHTAGCVCNVLGCLAAGAALIEMPSFDARRALELIESERATILNGAPTMFVRMTDIMDEDARSGRVYDLSSFKVCFTGGTTILPAQMQQIKDRMGADPLVIFGMTETSPLVTMTLPGDSFELCAGTAGKALAHTSVRITDPDTGGVVPIGTQGELQIRGYLTMMGYYQLPERTAETIVDGGWLRSGDLATMDAQGYVRITGRLKDMIIRGGENIYPAEIENALQTHPKIAQAQIVGVPDREYGEECYAFIELKSGERATEDEIASWCRGHMARHKLPRYIEFVDGFPTTASGKIKKFELRDIALRNVTAAANT